MALRVIACRLGQPETNADAICSTISHLGESLRFMATIWVINCTLSNAMLGKVLRPYLAEGDAILIAELSGDCATAGWAVEQMNWLWENIVSLSGPRERHETYSTT